MKLSAVTIAAAGAMAVSGCHTAKTAEQSAEARPDRETPVLVMDNVPVRQPGGTVRASQTVIPRAVAYRMTGAYQDNVPVTLGADGEILSYPAPSDLGPDSTPVDLGDGWWLDRRGVGENSVFTRYTYAEYRALKSAPTLAELKAAIIPGARVECVTPLSMTLSQAGENLDAVRAELPAIPRL